MRAQDGHASLQLPMISNLMTSRDADKIDIFKLPDEIYGVFVDGIDLTMLSLDSTRLILAYGEQEGELSDIQTKFLYRCDTEFKVVIPKTDDRIKKYLEQVHKGVISVIKKVERD